MDGYYNTILFGRRPIQGFSLLIVLIFLVLVIQPSAAVLTPSFYGINQANMTLVADSYADGYLAYGDYLFLYDTTTVGAGDSITDWHWNITTAPDPLAYAGQRDQYIQNPVFGPFLNATQLTVKLVVDNFTSTPYSNEKTYLVTDNRTYIRPEYSVSADYLNKSPDNPRGTMTLNDTSVVYHYPMNEIVQWWWKVTNDSGISFNATGNDNFTVTLSDTESYTVNLTVMSDEGRLGSITGHVSVPPDDLGLIPNYAIVPVSGQAPLNVSFIDLSSGNIVGWEWNFDILNVDPGTPNLSYDQNPMHTYTSPGLYSVSLTISDNFTTATATGGVITAYPPPAPTVNFALAPVSGIKPLNVTAIAQVTGMNQSPVYRWNFGDGTVIDTSVPSFVNEYNETGTDPSLTWEYEVGLVVISDGTQYEVPYTRNVTMENPSPPRARFTAYPRIGPAPLEVAFIDQSEGREPFQNEWYFDDPNTLPLTSFEQNPTHVFNETGVYNVTMRLHAANGFDQEYMNITVTEAVPERVDFTVAPTKGSNPLNVTVISQTTGLNESPVYYWDFGNGTALNTTIPSHVYQYNPYSPDPNMNWTYTISHVVYSDGIGYPAPYSWNVTVDNAPKPKALFNAYPREGSAPLEVAFFDQSVGQQPIRYEWYFGDNSPKVFDDPNPVWVYTEPGEYNVTLMIHAANGGDIINQTGLIRVNEHPDPIAAFVPVPSYGPAPLNVTFIDVSIGDITKWSWEFGDGATSQDSNPSYQYQQVGNYTVNLTVEDREGAINRTSSDRPVRVYRHGDEYETPEARFTYELVSDASNRKMKFIDASLNVPTNWLWNFGDNSYSYEKDPTHTFELFGTYEVKLTVSNPAGANTTQRDIILPAPVDPVTAGFEVKKTGTRTFRFTDDSLGPILSYYLSFGDGTSAIFNEKWEVFHTFTKIGYYPVTLQVTNGKNTNTFMKRVFVL